jgi:hypothetical protein
MSSPNLAYWVYDLFLKIQVLGFYQKVGDRLVCKYRGAKLISKVSMLMQVITHQMLGVKLIIQCKY